MSKDKKPIVDVSGKPKNMQERIAHHIVQQEIEKPGYSEKLHSYIKDKGHAEAAEGHAVVSHGGLLRVLTPDEFSDWKDEQAEKKRAKAQAKEPTEVEKSLKDILISVLQKAIEKNSKLGTTSSGSSIYAQNSDRNWSKRYDKFSSDDHDEAAAMHMKAAEDHHKDKNHDKRDSSLGEALEHMSRSGSKKHHKQYSSLMDKYHGED